ncbi:Myotubularin-related protein 8 [Histomonas meleagridis]|uniref:Myotubularin-related protein 8 n=1 Tax=Histomonas meleagridis TaxID=135588 RepID=UPI0035599382|nr:Myotubularin-related protein 8 [Histomonas meleagridis]KAH0805997.1 Myotubularin-related protein 8 [Histomonas meleagridis]
MSIPQKSQSTTVFAGLHLKSANASSPEMAESLRSRFTLLPEEEIRFFHYYHHISHGDVFLFATNWALRFAFNEWTKAVQDYTIPLKNIVSYKKKKRTTKNGDLIVSIKTSTLSVVHVTFPKSADNLVEGFTKTIDGLIENVLKLPTDVWVPDEKWLDRLANDSQWDFINNDFCPTYPHIFLIPPTTNRELIIKVSEFRSRQRVPALSFVYPKNKAPLLRSAQPLTGFIGSSNPYDVKFFEAVRAGRKFAIIDCRPKLNAFANQFTGGGYESKSHYDDSTFKFLCIPNIHKVREYYLTMQYGFENGYDDPFKDWGALILQLIKGSALIISKLKKNIAVLVHCSDGWDRTAQVSSIVQLIVDPYSRTFQGMKDLIQKDWIDAGHMFHMRCNYVPHSKLDESSPIFSQFIDAVYQLMVLNPTAFEFNECFLAFLNFHAYSQLFGDFDGQSFVEKSTMERAPSLWLCLEDEEFRLSMTNENFKDVNDLIKYDVKGYKFSARINLPPIFGGLSTTPLYPKNPEFWEKLMKK